jgi:predicted ATP-grasp superfamily ATP-dependent carboligase
MNNQETVIVFGSNVASLTIIKYIKKYIPRVIILGHDNEQMGAIIADEFRKIDYRDLSTIIAATENENNIIGCIPSGHDLSYLAYALYLDYKENNKNNRVELFEKIHNKSFFRYNLKKIAPKRCPDYRDINDAELINKISKFPILYKPNHAGGGRGIKYYIDQVSLNKDLELKKNEPGIYEQYIKGIDYSISLWFQDSQVIAFYADREFSSKNSFKINSSITNQEIIDYFFKLK